MVKLFFAHAVADSTNLTTQNTVTNPVFEEHLRLVHDDSDFASLGCSTSLRLTSGLDTFVRRRAIGKKFDKSPKFHAALIPPVSLGSYRNDCAGLVHLVFPAAGIVAAAPEYIRTSCVVGLAHVRFTSGGSRIAPKNPISTRYR
jgi:hypothetical protein